MLKILQKQGHHVALAETGTEAVRQQAAGRFELILMDLQMPELSGIEAAIEIRKWEAGAGLKAVPIFALTANADEESARQCMNVGMQGVLTKPFQVRELLELLESIKQAD